MKKKLTIAVLVAVAAMMLAIFVPRTAQAAEPGWIKIDGYWYYYYDDSYCASGGVCYIEEDSCFYFFDDEGRMQTGWVKEVYTFDDGTYTDWFYANSNGVLLNGWQKIGGVWYYFETEDYSVPYMYYGGRRMINGKYYYFNDGGKMLTGWIKESFTVDSGYTYTNWFYANSSGALVNGWQKIGNTWYYFDPDYYSMYSDRILEVDGKAYFFYPSGAMGTGWIKRTYDISYEGYTEVDWFYANSSGVLQTGWQKIGSEWYYFEPYGYYMQTGYRIIDGKVYIFQSNGAWATKAGWLKVEFPSGYYDWYYLKAGGEPYTGWQKIDGKWYYFYPEVGWMAYKQTMQINGKLYLFEESGALASKGWKKFSYKGEGGTVNTYWFYANADGTVKTGWYYENGIWYYFYPYSGVMASNPIVIDGKINLFKSNGAWIDYAKVGWVKGESYSYHTTWYYCIDDQGTPATCWKEINGVTYYFDPTSYQMYSEGIRQIDGSFYFFNNDGGLEKGLIKHTYNYGSIDNPHYYTQYYYANEEGVLQSGWQMIDGKEYYFTGEKYGFYAYVNTAQYIDAEGDHIAGVYIFDENGVCVGKPGTSEVMS